MTGIQLARRWAEFYASMSWNPLPSIPGIKIPAFRGGYSRHRDEGIGPDVLDRWWTPSIQLATGSRWGLAVVDLDGVLARDWWADQPDRPPTWTVRTRRGVHLWYAVARGGPEIPHKTVLWSVPDAKHQAVEVLGDRNLVVAPPSPFGSHPGRYAFAPGLGPAELPAPAPLPAWVARSLVDVPSGPAGHPLRIYPRPAPVPGLGHCSRADVLAAIPDKVALAESWGLRFASHSPNHRGWYPCHAAFRDDRHPSAMLAGESGCYWEPWMDRKPYSFFDLAAAMGVYASWRDAVNALGHEYGVRARHAG